MRAPGGFLAALRGAVHGLGVASLKLFQGISLIAASAPSFFLEETPTAVLVRQVLGGAPGIIRAIEECFPRSARQRCLARRSAGA